jgi:hypothetical protein
MNMEQPLSDADISTMRSRLELLFEYYVADNWVVAEPVTKLFRVCHSRMDHLGAIEILLRADFARVLAAMTTEKPGYDQRQIHAALAGALARLQALEEAMLQEEGEA